MNDKDLKEFSKWHDENIVNPPTLNELIEKAWKDACLYKQKEIDKIKDTSLNHLIIERFMEHNEKLQTENAKLRECVEFYSVNGLSKAKTGDVIDVKLTNEIYLNGGYARQVLKELEDK